MRHREVAKQLAPAFSTRTIRALELLTQRHLNFFIARMQELESMHEVIELSEWTNWLAIDLSADVSWNEGMNRMRDGMLAK